MPWHFCQNVVAKITVVGRLAWKMKSEGFEPIPQSAQAGVKYRKDKAIHASFSCYSLCAIAPDISYGKLAPVGRITAAGLDASIRHDKKYIPRPSAVVLLKPCAIPGIF